MAKFLLISYDLKRPGQNYSELYEEIKNSGEWQHPLESTWILKVHNYVTPADIYSILRPNIDDNDFLFVVDITDQNYYGWLPKNFWTWFKQR